MSRAATRTGLALALALGMGMGPGAASADEDEEMGRRLQQALRAQHGDVHRCYAAALQRDPGGKGELLVQIEMGEGGKVARAKVLKDQTSAPGLASCLELAIARWSLPQLGAEPGSTVVFPLAFHPEDVAAPPASKPPKKASSSSDDRLRPDRRAAPPPADRARVRPRRDRPEKPDVGRGGAVPP